MLYRLTAYSRDTYVKKTKGRKNASLYPSILFCINLYDRALSVITKNFCNNFVYYIIFNNGLV